MRIACAFVLLLLVGSAFSADPQAVIKITADELSKEYKANEKAAAAKYKGRTLEVTGVVWFTRPELPDVLVSDSRGSLRTPVSCSVTKAERQKVTGLAKGQTITMRGPSGTFLSPTIGPCEFVKIGPSTAIPVTVTGVLGEFKTNDEPAKEKYRHASVVTKVKVLDRKVERTEVVWTVGDPTAAGGPTAMAKTKTYFLKDEMAEFEAVKVGDVVLLIADVNIGTIPVSFSNILLLKELPAGVKLAGSDGGKSPTK